MVSEIVYFLLLGLAIGGLYGMLGTGIVVGYKGSGVINFALGAIAMFGAFQFDELRNYGRLQMPWVDILPTNRLNLPVQIELTGNEMSTAAALPIALLFVAGLGALVHLLVFAPLRYAAPLGKVVASVGLLGYLQGVALNNFGADFRLPQRVLPEASLLNFLGLGRPLDPTHLILPAIALLAAVALSLWYRRSRFGLATVGSAEREEGAILLGYSPRRLALVSWILSALLAAFGAILLGPIQGALTPVSLSALVVPALGAALVAGLNSVIVTVLAGLTLGMVQAFFSSWLIVPGNADWLPTWLHTAEDAIPLVVIVIALYLRGDRLPTRGAVTEVPLPRSPRPAHVVPYTIVFAVLGVGASLVVRGSWAFALTTSLISMILMLSFVVISGYLGQASLAQLSLAGVGAFVMAKLLASNDSDSAFGMTGPAWPWPLALVVGIAAASATGLLLALPALRIRGVQLAVVTMAAAVTIQSLYFENSNLTGVSAGSNVPVPSPTFFGIDIGSTGGTGLTDNPPFTVLTIVAVLAAAVLVALIRRGRLGRRFLAVRANERAAAAIGINVTSTKLLGFGISAAVAGLAGCLFSFQQSAISPANWTPGLGIVFLTFAYMGGISSISGAMFAGVLVPAGLLTAAVSDVFGNSNIDSYLAVIGGAGVILTVINQPEGIPAYFARVARSLAQKLRSSAPARRGALEPQGEP